MSPNVRPTIPKPILSQWSAAVLTIGALVAGLGVTATWLYWLRQAAEAEDKLRFMQQVDRLQADIDTRFRLPHYGMAGLRASVAAADGALNRDSFRNYVEARNLEVEFPGVRGFAFIERISREAVPALEGIERAGGVKGFTVYGAGSETVLYVVRYIEPLSHNPDGHFKFPHLWPVQIPPGKTTRL